MNMELKNCDKDIIINNIYKTKVKFKEPFAEIIDVESYKTFNILKPFENDNIEEMLKEHREKNDNENEEDEDEEEKFNINDYVPIKQEKNKFNRDPKTKCEGCLLY